MHILYLIGRGPCFNIDGELMISIPGIRHQRDAGDRAFLYQMKVLA